MLEKTFEAKELSLGGVFSDDYLFEIPYFQRPYAWTTEETDELLTDLMAAMDESSGTQSYFLGSVVLVKVPSDSVEYQVIDGQQRLTTLTMLICVLREFASEKMGKDLEEFVWQEGNLAKGTRVC